MPVVRLFLPLALLFCAACPAEEQTATSGDADAAIADADVVADATLDTVADAVGAPDTSADTVVVPEPDVDVADTPADTAPDAVPDGLSDTGPDGVFDAQQDADAEQDADVPPLCEGLEPLASSALPSCSSNTLACVLDCAGDDTCVSGCLGGSSFGVISCSDCVEHQRLECLKQAGCGDAVDALACCEGDCTAEETALDACVAGLAADTCADETVGVIGSCFDKVDLGASPHVVPLVVPSCAGAEVINGPSQLDKLNDPNKFVFCVSPGDYTSADNFTITASGSAAQPRWILPLNPGVHPVDRAENDRAVFGRVRFDHDVDHWVLHELTFRSPNPQAILSFQCAKDDDPSDISYCHPGYTDAQSNDVIFDRLLVEGGGGGGGAVKINGQDHVLQNSVVRQTAVTGPGADDHCVLLSPPSRNVRVVDNEIYDCTGDGLQIHSGGGDGAIIDGNDMYLTPALYSDCSGNPDPNGNCACAENAIDLKGPGPSADLTATTVQITNNRLWGFKPTDAGCAGSGSPGTPVAIGSGVDNSVDNVLIAGNVVRDSSAGISLGVATVTHVSVHGNLLHGLGNGTKSGVAMNNLSNDHVEFYANTVVGADHWFRINAGAGHNDVRCNVVIGSGDRPYRSEPFGGEVAELAPDGNTVVDYNFFYGTDASYPLLAPYGNGDPSNDIVVFDDPEPELVAAQEAYCHYSNRWTGPNLMCLAHGRPSPASPYLNACDPQLGSRPGIGVSNATPPPSAVWLGTPP